MDKIKECLNMFLEVANDNGIIITGADYVQLVIGMLMAETTMSTSQKVDSLIKETEAMMKDFRPPQEFNGELVKGTVTELGKE